MLDSNGNITAAAGECGVSVRTLHRYLKHPDFRNELQTARGQALNLALNRLSGGAKQAVDTLLTITASEKTPAAVRVQAASQILAHVTRLTEQIDLIERIEKLEARNGKP